MARTEQAEKIFGIGFHKTGTKTLKKALEILGYDVTGPNGVNDANIGEDLYSLIDELVPKYDAFQDNPWPVVYRYLDERYPGSRFILTMRDSDDWVASVVRYFGRKTTPMRKMIYGAGSPVGYEALYQKRFEEHNKEVLAYFSDKPERLLVLNFFEHDGWEKLCRFLGKEIPDVPFPHENRSREDV